MNDKRNNNDNNQKKIQTRTTRILHGTTHNPLGLHSFVKLQVKRLKEFTFWQCLGSLL